MPLSPDWFERLAMLHLHKGPGPMLDLAGAMTAKAVNTAIKLRIFEALEQEALAPADLAVRCGADPRGITLLLEALESSGYLRSSDGVWALTTMSRVWLLPSSPRYIGGVFAYIDDAMRRWDYLDESIRAGAPPRTGREWMDGREGAWDRYQAGMCGLARLVGPEVVSRTPLRRRTRRLLDIGGGHGLYAVLFCRRYPDLRATVLDLPQCRTAALETIAAAGMERRVEFQHGDFHGTRQRQALL